MRTVRWLFRLRAVAASFSWIATRAAVRPFALVRSGVILFFRRKGVPRHAVRETISLRYFQLHRKLCQVPQVRARKQSDLRHPHSPSE